MRKARLFLVMLMATPLACADPPPGLPPGNNPVPVDGAAWVAQALQTQGIVGLSDLHGCREEHAFYMALLDDPSVLRHLQVVVLEANSRHQATADTYVQGGSVSRATLAQIWLDSTAMFFWGETPQSSAILNRVREINSTRAPTNRIRVVLGDVSVNWSTTHTREDREAQLANREEAIYQNLKTKVALPGKRAIVIMGGAHLLRLPDAPFVTPLQRIEQEHPGKTRVVILHEGLGQLNARGERRLQHWAPGSIATLAGTWLGNITEWGQGGDILEPPPGEEPLPPAEPVRLEQVADGYLYVGIVESLTAFNTYPTEFRKQAWWDELQRRHLIVFGGPINPRGEQFQPVLKYYAPGVIAGIPLPPFLPQEPR